MMNKVLRCILHSHLALPDICRVNEMNQNGMAIWFWEQISIRLDATATYIMEPRGFVPHKSYLIYIGTFAYQVTGAIIGSRYTRQTFAHTVMIVIYNRQMVRHFTFLR